MKSETGAEDGIYEERDDGLYLVRGSDGDASRIAPPISYVGRAERADGSMTSIVLALRSVSGRQQELIVSVQDVQLSSKKFYERLLDLGYPAGNDMPALHAVRAYALHCFNSRPEQILLVDSCGWVEELSIFVRGKEVISASGTIDVRLMGPIAALVAKFGTSGTLPRWKRRVAARCARSSRLTFALCAAFASPLLKIVHMEGGGFNFTGQSGIGKSTALKAAASVFGGGVSGNVESWNMTDAAPGTLALIHRGMILCLDELDELDADSKVGAKRLRSIIHQLANGRRRSISHRAKVDDIRTLTASIFLSSSERSVPAFIREGGALISGGELVRFVDIPADARQKLGILDSTPRIKGKRERIEWETYLGKISKAAAANYGVAGQRFLEMLMKARDKGPQTLSAKIEGMMSELIDQAKGQAISRVDMRILRRFALVLAAGRLAQEFEILPPECKVEQAVKECLRAAVAMHVALQPAKEVTLREAASTILKLAARSRKRTVVVDGDEGKVSKSVYDKCDVIVRKQGDGGTIVMVKPARFKRAFPVQWRDVAKRLRASGALIPGAKSNVSQHRIPGLAGARGGFYCFDRARLKLLTDQT